MKPILIGAQKLRNAYSNCLLLFSLSEETQNFKSHKIDHSIRVTWCLLSFTTASWLKTRLVIWYEKESSIVCFLLRSCTIGYFFQAAPDLDGEGLGAQVWGEAPCSDTQSVGKGWSTKSLVFPRIINVYDVILWCHIC